MEKICVAIRVKPTSTQEANNGTRWKVAANTISLHSALGTPIKGQTYSFDTIFGVSTTNAEIYEEHAKDLVLSAVSGFNGTVFAYGQTSSGKTYTMQGSATDQGVTRLAIQDVFTSIDKIVDREFLVRVSYMEIYNEEINDLLAPDNRKLQIHESIERGIFVAGLREEIADSVEQVIAVLERGEAQRHLAETDMNVNSSRSHTIFRMVIESRDKSHDSTQDSDPSAQDAVRVSALNLVDLAGSERISKTGAEGVRLREGAHINKSLTTLGMVINKLSEGGGKQGAHVPYRDSKLTRILQSALGGNARTSIICTINPDEIHIDETRGTLQFASRAKRVTNCAQVNEILTDAALLKRQKEEIKELKRRLEGSSHSEDLKKEILQLRNDLLKYELGREKLELELQQEIKAQVERERRIKEQEQRIENLSTMVISGAIEDRELPTKSHRRETWCPQSSISNTLEQGLRRINGRNSQLTASSLVDAKSRPLATRRDRTFGLPPAFESLLSDECDSFWSGSSGVNSLPHFSDFENIADEDMCASFNRGALESVTDEDTWGNMKDCHVSSDSRLSHGSSDTENAQGFRQIQFPLLAESSRKNTLFKQLNAMNLQYQELQSSIEFKIQEKIKEAVAAANSALLEEKSRFQLQEITKLHGVVKDLEIELEKCNEENKRLKSETALLQEQVLHAREALEQEAQERVSMDEQNEFFKQRLRSLEMRIQGDINQQCNEVSCSGVDFEPDVLEVNESNEICSECQSFADNSIQRPLMLSGALIGGCVSRRFPNENHDRQMSEILMHKIHKRRLFDDDDSSVFQIAEDRDQDWTGSRIRPTPGNAAYSDDILAALSRLCCRFKQLSGSGVKKIESFTKDFGAPQERKNLKASLHLAYQLGRSLLQELQRIINHDIQCLETHVASKGTIGKSLEALQMLLLECADVGLCLMHNLSSKEPSFTSQVIQVANDGASYRGDDFICKNRSTNILDETQLVSDGSVFSVHNPHDSSNGDSMKGWCEDQKAARNSVMPANAWVQSLDVVSVLSSQDAGEDICNIDLHQDCDEESGLVSKCISCVSSDVQMADGLHTIEMSQEYMMTAQGDEIISDLKSKQNMSEAEKLFTKELLNKVKALEARLTVAEMEIVEYKVEIEHLRVNNLRTSMEVSQNGDDWELQQLRAECEMHKEEIRQLMEQVMTPDAELERESLFRETMERNTFLEKCLNKAESRLIRAKGWRKELLRVREAEAHREKAFHDIQARNAALEIEGVLLRQALSKAQQSVVSKNADLIETLDEVTTVEISKEAEPVKFQLLSSGGAEMPSTFPTPFKDPIDRPLRKALGEIKNLLQPCILKDLGGYICKFPDVGKLLKSDISEKENQPCLQGSITAAH
uniref:Kinesin motor domain-containing protein n=1 Tax=Physcomitrium patens TaxID=3218 RepID=A0A7I4FLL1_PHYPA